MKEALCKLFCQNLVVREVPIGLSVGTSFRLNNGDAACFYVSFEDATRSRGRIEDDGLTIGSLEAAGVNLTSGPRADQFGALMSQFGVHLDQEDVLLHTETMAADKLPSAALNFLAFIMRSQELTNWTREVVEATFKDDVIKAIQSHFTQKAEVLIGRHAEDKFGGVPVDAVLVPTEGMPLALFIGTSETKGLEAMVLWSDVRAKMASPAHVMLIVDKVRTRRFSERTYARASNRFPIGVVGHKEDVLESIERHLFSPGDAYGDQAIH